MKLILLATERTVITEFLPRESSMTDLLTARDIVRKTKLTLEEDQKLKYYRIGNTVQIFDESDFEKEIDFNKAELQLLKDGYKKLSEANKITLATVSLAEKIRDITIPSFSDEAKMKLKK